MATPCSLFRIAISAPVNGYPVQMSNGDSMVLVAVGYDVSNIPQHATAFTWSSSDSSIVSVSAAGVITANKKGMCDITATSGSTVGSVTIRVVK